MNKEEIINEIEKMSVLDLVELVKAIEEKFGVSAQMPVAFAPQAGPSQAGGAAQEAAKTEFDVVLTDAGSQKIQVIKVVKDITGLGLKEAKELVDGAPKAIKEKVSEKEAEDIKEKLVGAGATVEIR
jgi:large subunit ribosomal protein L7/L12